MSALSLRDIARATNGQIVGRQVLAAGPNHRPGDESLSITLSPQSPNGILVHSFAGDDWKLCRDYVADKLGFGSDAWRRPGRERLPPQSVSSTTDEDDRRKRMVRAVEIWSEAKDPRGTSVERYLAGRGLNLPDSSDALRFHPRCPWQGPDGKLIRVPAMVAAMRSVAGDSITGIHRTRLTETGEKVDRRMLGIAAAAAVKLDADDTVTHGLAIGEGVESCLAARQLGFRPVWALASAGGIAGFPVLNGVEALTLLGENDPTSDRAITQCAERWHAAKREVTVVTPNFGSDLNDVVRAA